MRPRAESRSPCTVISSTARGARTSPLHPWRRMRAARPPNPSCRPARACNGPCATSLRFAALQASTCCCTTGRTPTPGANCPRGEPHSHGGGGAWPWSALAAAGRCAALCVLLCPAGHAACMSCIGSGRRAPCTNGAPLCASAPLPPRSSSAATLTSSRWCGTGRRWRRHWIALRPACSSSSSSSSCSSLAAAAARKALHLPNLPGAVAAAAAMQDGAGVGRGNGADRPALPAAAGGKCAHGRP